MKRASKKETNDGVITLEEFEGIMNKESLRRLPLLLNAMDENLSINIGEFINNKLIRHLRLHQAKLVEVIKSSHKFNYDNKSGMIKFKEKADRNILMTQRFIKGTSSGEKEEKEQMIRTIIKNLGVIYLNSIKKVDVVGDSFHFVFDHEDFSMDVEKYFLEVVLKPDFPRDHFNVDYFNDLLKSEVCLAAESLKRRIISNADPKYVNDWAQIQYINSISLNPVVYQPRRFTCKDNNAHLNMGQNSNKNSPSPNNKYDTAEANRRKSEQPERNTVYSKSINGMNDKNFNLKRFSKYRKSLCYNKINTLEENLPSTININKRTSIIVPTKFDLFDSDLALKGRHKAFTINNKIDAACIIDIPRLVNRRTSYKIVSENVLDLLFSSDCQVKTTKVHEPVIEQPIHKEHEDEHLFEDHSSDANESFISRKYNCKEIISVFHHMNFVEKIELPEEFKNSFIPAIMNEKCKNFLEIYKNVNKHLRMRSNTIMNQKQRKIIN